MREDFARRDPLNASRAKGITRAIRPEQAAAICAGPSNFAEWRVAGITGFGVGTALYQPGQSVAEVGKAAAAIVAAYDAMGG
ncbi:hypothetical protein ONR75_11350 [Rhodopseudomonas sp. P2A-2r]|uniref:hypothetical protein n=1 Tax=Rhodopseudomonas sp. P2A-2r TaxID=2991972 RepID=UPI0022342789|nr:hypothetical protein [Rhodopseudomonas sp. P2A-2r]UZE51152.1 hypothetical protein ONR75_11350 [Rhodopseudomonas sp. P2A-2r]